MERKMERCTVDQFPHPVPASPCGSRREIFTDYGSLGAVCVGRGATVAQKSHGSHVQPRLCASRPALPLLQSHPVSDPYEDMCVGELEKQRQKTLSALNTLTVIKSHVRKDTKQQEILQKRLCSLEARPTEENAGDNSNSQSSPYPMLPVMANTLRGQLGHTKDLPKVNSWYTGGCLSCVSTETPSGHKAALVYASGNSLCSLPISNIACGVDENSVDRVILDDRIYEVVTQQVGGDCYCVVRQMKKCCVFQVDVSQPSVTLLRSHDWSNLQETPSGICLSPYIAGECTVATDNGSVYLWSADGRCEVVCGSAESRFSVVDNWHSCHYGAHPREVILSDRTGVSLFDIRQSARTVQLDLFILPHRLLHPADRVMVSGQHVHNAFLHVVATDHNLVVIDERFPSSPVLHWSHTLTSPPQYIDVISGLAPPLSSDRGLGDDVTLLASQTSHETHCFQWTAGTPPQPPHTTVTPWRVSQAEDFVHLCRGEGVLSHQSLLARLSVSLIGMCALSHPKGEGFTVFQMTAHGDICHQTYHFSDTATTDVTCVAGPGSDAVSLDAVTREMCTRWQQEAERTTQTVDDATTEWTLRHCHTSHYYPGLSTETYPHVLCALCMPQWQRTAPVTSDTDLEELCHKCGNSLLCGRQFKDSIHKGVIPPNMDDTSVEIDTCLSSHDPGQFVDSTSKLLTKLWGEDYDIYHLLQQKEEDPVKKPQSAAVTVAMETPDNALDTSHVNSDHLDQPVTETPMVRREGSDHPSDHPSTSTASVIPSPQAAIRRRYLSTSSVDTVSSMTARGHTKPGFHSTPPRLRHSADVHNTNISSARASPLHSRLSQKLQSPGTKHQNLEPARCRELSFSRDHGTVLPPGANSAIVSSAHESMLDTTNVASPALTSTGKKKRRKFVIGF